jgi:hypothetical protein
MESYIQSERGAPSIEKELRENLSSLSSVCEGRTLAQDFVQQLQGATLGVRAERNQPASSRKTTKAVFIHFAEHMMREPMRQQQKTLRMKHGTRLNFDNTNRSVASFSAAQNEALTSGNARKPASYIASVATGTMEGCWAAVAVTAPSDTHDVILAIICGLLGAVLPRDLAGVQYLQIVRDDVAADGQMAHFPALLTTDYSDKDIHVWRRVCQEVLSVSPCYS